MNNYRIITLRERPELVAIAAEWFHSKWGVPAEAYLECMKAYLSGKTEYGWYICLYDESMNELDLAHEVVEILVLFICLLSCLELCVSVILLDSCAEFSCKFDDVHNCTP